MRQRSPSPQTMRFGIRLFFALTVAALGVWLVQADDATKRPGAEQPAASPAKVISQLNALAVQFDADHDRTLSPKEQDAMVKYVEQQHGRPWADRAREFLRSADANGDGIVDEQEWRRAIDKLSSQQGRKEIAKIAASNGGVSTAGAAKKQTFMVAMSDGVRLATDVYLPAGDGPFPVILVRTPYDKSNKMFTGSASGQAGEGYAGVVQDMRGRFASQGENLPHIGCGWGEHKDGVETIAWIRRQPWCNGKIGTVGGSAMGTTQNLLAVAAPEGLTAQYISNAPASMYHHAAYVGGALRKCQVENWVKGTKFDPLAFELALAHPSYDAFWTDRDTTLRFAVMNVPAVHHAGWFDTFQQGTIDSFVGRQHQGAEGARGRQKLVIGPWHHGGTDHGMVGDLAFPNSGAPPAYDSRRWFEYHLKGVDNGIMNEPAVAYYVMGDTADPKAPGNQWRTADDWPIKNTPTSYYFGSGGRLTSARPPAASDPVEYTFDPADPCPTIGGANLTITRGPRNQNPIESRGDVVLFSTEPLAKPLEVTGRVTARVFVASSAADSDLSVRLCDVYPNGKSYLMAEGMLRLRYRHSMAMPEPLTPGRIEEVAVDCWSTSIIFNRGHRLRVAVTSSNYPRFDLNPGTGQPWTDGGAKRKQTNRIHTDAAHPSCIVLPFVETASQK